MRFILGLSLLTSGFFLHHSEACTRVLWNDKDVPVRVGRSMDWPESTDPEIWVMPRGIERDGGTPENPAKWKSKYGSVVTSVYQIGSADGLNEHGLVAHLLFLRAANFGARDLKKQGLLAGRWAQYVLDNFETVEDALTALKNIQPVMQEAKGFKATVHFALEDAKGDSAIIEYINGKPVIHHGKQYTVMTNDPPYDQQLANIKKYNFSHPTSTTPLPGNVNPIDRFVRATYFRQLLRKPANDREGVAALLSIIRNVSVPFDAPYTNDPRFSVYNTEYRTLSDLGSRTYFWEYSRSPNVFWISLKGLNFTAGAPVMKLDPTQLELNGEVSSDFKKVAQAPY